MEAPRALAQIGTGNVEVSSCRFVGRLVGLGPADEGLECGVSRNPAFLKIQEAGSGTPADELLLDETMCATDAGESPEFCFPAV